MCLVRIDPRMDFDASVALRSPADVLCLDYLQPRAIPLARFARRTGIPMTVLREITRGRRRIHAEYALRLSCVLDATPAYWLLLQARHDLAMMGTQRHSQ